MFQERLYRRPFWMLVACLLVNRTRWTQAEPVHRELMRRYRTPGGLAAADYAELWKIVQVLGFGNAKTTNLIGFAKAWCRYGRTKRRRAGDVRLMPGCGQYAVDSWVIFMDGRRNVRPKDKELRKYLRRKRAADKATLVWAGERDR